MEFIVVIYRKASFAAKEVGLIKKARQKDKLDFAKQEGQHWREHFKVKNIEMIG